MKTLKSLIAGSLVLLLAPSAMAALYVGKWKNTTFGSSGALKIDLKITAAKVIGSLDLDGNVFGGANPPAIPFDLARDPDGVTTVRIRNTSIGDLGLTFRDNGKIAIKITNIPGGFLSEGRVDGKFDLNLQTFAGTYEVDDPEGELYASGTLAARVHKAPVIKTPSPVNVTGKTVTVTVNVISNAKITSFTVAVDQGATVSKTGTNPYEVTVKNITAAETHLTLKAKNADDLRSTKVIKIFKSAAGVVPGG